MLEPTFIVRRAVREDEEAITRFCILGAKESVNKDLDPTLVRSGVVHVLRDHADFYIIAKKGENYVGQLKIHRHYYDWYDETLWWVEHVYVDKDYRRQGIAQKMLKFVERYAKEHGYVKGLFLFVGKHNQSAINSYQRFGFHKPELYLMFHQNDSWEPT